MIKGDGICRLFRMLINPANAKIPANGKKNAWGFLLAASATFAACGHLRLCKIPCLQICFLVLRGFSVSGKALTLSTLKGDGICRLFRMLINPANAKIPANEKKNAWGFLLAASATFAACGHLRLCKIPCLQICFLALRGFSVSGKALTLSTLKGDGICRLLCNATNKQKYHIFNKLHEEGCLLFNGMLE